MSKKIPVTVITGFLGSGKTTIVQHLLKNNRGRRIAVLVNEFGELGIDGELLKDCQICDDENEASNNIIELTNGCLCCTVQEEFFPAMKALIERRDRIDAIVIETSGLALPKPLVTAFRWPEIKHAATVDAVVAVVDAVAVAEGKFASDPAAIQAMREEDDSLEHETPLQELFEDQLACADLIIINKTDLIDDSKLAKVCEIVDKETPRPVKKVISDRGYVSPETIFGFTAAVEDNLADRPSHHDSEEEHEHDDGINSYHWQTNLPVNPDILRSQIAGIIADREIYRVKGFVAVPHKSMRLVVQCVGNRYDAFYDRLWQPHEDRTTKLVFIGQNLNSHEIANCLTTISL